MFHDPIPEEIEERWEEEVIDHIGISGRLFLQDG